jgi:hypothetical protein
MMFEIPLPRVVSEREEVEIVGVFGINLIQKHAIVAPRQLCNRLLHNWPSLREGSHVSEIPGRESLHPRELSAEILGKALDYFRSPTLVALTGKNLLADPPVKQNKLLVYGKGGANLGCPNPLVE